MQIKFCTSYNYKAYFLVVDRNLKNYRRYIFRLKSAGK